MENKKLTWWQYINQDRTFVLFFILAFVGLVLVVLFDQMSPFYSATWFVAALSVPCIMMASIGYFIFYRGWKKYLDEDKRT